MEVDLAVKIIVSLASLVTLWIFRRNIKNIVGGLMINGNISEYDGSSDTDVTAMIGERLDSILGDGKA